MRAELAVEKLFVKNAWRHRAGLGCEQYPPQVPAQTVPGGSVIALTFNCSPWTICKALAWELS